MRTKPPVEITERDVQAGTEARRGDGRQGRLGKFLRESRAPGSNGATARKITVKLYGKGVLAKAEDRAGSAKTQYHRRSAGQLIYSKLDFLNGAIGIVPPELDGYESTLDLPCFDIDTTRVDPQWLLAALSRPAFYERFRGTAVGGRKAKRVQPAEILAFRLAIPPLPEQRRIAAALGSVDRSIAASRTLIDALREARKAVLGDLLASLGRTAGSDSRPARRSVPSRAVGEVATFRSGNGFTPADWSSAGLPIIRIQDLNGTGVQHFFRGTPDPRWIVEPGALLFAWAGTKGVSFGPRLWPGPRAVLNQHIYQVDPSPEIDRKYLYLALQALTARIEERAHGFKTTLVHVHKSDITDARIPVPCLAEQRRIAAAGEAFDRRIEREETALDRLEEAKQALAQGLLGGHCIAREGAL